MEWTVLACNRVNKAGLGSTGLGSSAQDWPGMGWALPAWDGMGCVVRAWDGHYGPGMGLEELKMVV